MKWKLYPVAILSACVLQACSSSPTTQSEHDTVKASLDQPNSIKPQTFMLRGEVVVGQEVRTFTPCGSNQQFWLEMPAELTQQTMKLSSPPYQPLYGELVGYLMPPSKTGYNGDYSARFIVQNVNIISAENPKRCQHAHSPTRAFGNEPGWSVKFGAKQLSFNTMDGQQQTIAIERSQLDNQQRQYQFKEGELNLKHELCSDGMSDSLYGWQSEFSLNDQDYQGCATLGNSDPSLSWAGQYFATSTENNNFSVTLTVNKDHSATTEYTYNNGEAPIVEKGFWQQLNKQQIQVVMTRHQQQYLVSERIFTLDGVKIIAEKEKVGSVVYPLANGGLVLFADNSSSQ